MLKICALVLAGAALVHAQIPQHCSSPPVLTFGAIVHEHDFNLFRRYDVVYDAENERVAFNELREDRVFPGKEYFRIILLHKFDIAYEINLKTNKCKKSTAGEFFHLGVPANATFWGDYYTGGPGESIDTTEWFDRKDFRSEHWIGVFSRRQCYPLRTYLQNNFQLKTVTTFYYNVVEGISNPEWFRPPSSCLGIEKHEQSDHVTSLRSTYTHTLH